MFWVYQGIRGDGGYYFTATGSGVALNVACKMYPPPPLVQGQRQGQNIYRVELREQEKQKEKRV